MSTHLVAVVIDADDPAAAARPPSSSSDDVTRTVLADPEGNEFCVLSSREIPGLSPEAG